MHRNVERLWPSYGVLIWEWKFAAIGVNAEYMINWKIQ